MLRSMTAGEFQGWRDYYELEPSLDERIDWLIASVREMVHNVAVAGKHQKPLKDFLLDFGKKAPTVQKMDWRQQKAMMLMFLESNSQAKD